jgi:hypothetical protein
LRSPSPTAAATSQAEKRLAAVVGYARATGCRRRYILAHFGEESGGACGRCDRCAGDLGAVWADVVPAEVPEVALATDTAQALLDAIAWVDDGTAEGFLLQMLLGNRYRYGRTGPELPRRLLASDFFGRLQHLGSTKRLTAAVDRLVADSAVERADVSGRADAYTYKTLRLTETGERRRRGRAPLTVRFAP